MDGCMPHLRLKKNLERQVETKQLKQNYGQSNLNNTNSDKEIIVKGVAGRNEMANSTKPG